MADAADEDPTLQAQRISEAVNAGANAILLSASDAGKLVGAVDEAVARGVPVMTFDSDVPQLEAVLVLRRRRRVDGHAGDAGAGEADGRQGQVAILAGNQNAPNLQKRVEGVKEAAKKYPGITILNTFYHAETPQDAAAEVMRAQNAYPDIQGWAMIGGWALFTPSLLTDLDPKQVKIVPVDALPVELPYVDDGLAPVLFAQPTVSLGLRVGEDDLRSRVSEEGRSGAHRDDADSRVEGQPGHVGAPAEDMGLHRHRSEILGDGEVTVVQRADCKSTRSSCG